MLATEYAEYYEIEPQREGESDRDFRGRVATALRQAGHLVEAHEAYQNERHETSNDVMTGLFGAVAQALSGTHYWGDPIGNDLAAGGLVRYQMSPEGKAQKEADALMARMLGAGMSPEDLAALMGKE